MFSRLKNPVFFWAVVLTLASGAAALSHQILWTRRMVDLLGASSESTIRVFAGFFLGLALGSALGGWLARRTSKPWRALGFAELGCALLTFPILTLPYWAGGMWQMLGPSGLEGGGGSAVKLLLPLLLVAPPAVLMGFFLPLIAKAVLNNERRLGKEGLLLYGTNTIGGVLGLLLTAVVLLPAVGALGAMLATVALNLMVAGGCFALAWNERKQPIVDTATVIGKNSSNRPNAMIAGVAFLSGYAILAAEAALLEMIQLVSPLSFYAPTALLIVVLAALALAAFLTPVLIRRNGSQRLLIFGFTAAAVISVITPWVFYISARQGWDLFHAEYFGFFLLKLIAFSFLVIGPLFLIAGLIFPAACAAQDELRGDKAGRNWGWLLAINGVGGFLGAETAYRFLLPWAGIYGTLMVTAALYGIAALWLLRWQWAGCSRWLRFGIPAVLVLCSTAVWHTQKLPTTNPDAPFDVLHTESGRDGSLAVIEGHGVGRGILLYNQYLLGNSGSRAEQERLGSLPLLLHANPKEICYIGLATGITPSAGLKHNAVEHTTVVEISPAVYRAARDWFGAYNYEITSAPKARVVIEDGRTFIAAHNEAFDVIIGDLFLPWGPGEGRLYATEHFRSIRTALRPGGAFFQWLPMHQLTAEQLSRILASFNRVFPEVEIFCAGFDAGQPLLGILGWRDGALDWRVVEERITAEANWLRDPLLLHPSGIALVYLGQLPPDAVKDQVPNTLNNMFLELEAGRRSVLVNSPQPYLTADAWLEHREKWIQENSFASLPQSLQPWPRSASQLTGIYLQARRNPRLTGQAAETARRFFPGEILYHRNADWTQWPGVPPWR